MTSNAGNRPVFEPDPEETGLQRTGLFLALATSFVLFVVASALIGGNATLKLLIGLSGVALLTGCYSAVALFVVRRGGKRCVTFAFAAEVCAMLLVLGLVVGSSVVLVVAEAPAGLGFLPPLVLTVPLLVVWARFHDWMELRIAPARRSSPAGTVREPAPPRTDPSPATTLPQVDRFTESARSALHHVTTSRRGGAPLDTRVMLLTIWDAHSSGRWSRIWLESRDPETIRRMERAAGAVADPDPAPRGLWLGAPLTGTTRTALLAAEQVSNRWQLGLISPGILALGLVSDPSSSASRALTDGTPLTRRRLLTLIQEDVLGVTLDGLQRELDTIVTSYR
ncbi:hypothetical protein MXD63_10770 [Frankia sp. Cpl3]|nr:hypothetical protein [Frankia sp. Cpl3]